MWTIDDEIHIFQVWEEHEIELRQYKRNSHVYAKMAEEMNGKFAAQEVHTKISNLIQKYRSEKKETGPSGGSPSKWSHFDYVNKIIGCNATNNSNLMESFFFHSTTSNSNSAPLLPPPLMDSVSFSPLVSSPPLFSPMPSASLPPDSEPPTSSSSKKKKINYNSKVLQNMSKLTEQGEEQLEILRNVAQDNRNKGETFTNFLHQQQENEHLFMDCLRNWWKKIKIQ